MQTVTGRHPYRFCHHEVFINVSAVVLEEMYLVWYSKQRNVVSRKHTALSQEKNMHQSVAGLTNLLVVKTSTIFAILFIAIKPFQKLTHAMNVLDYLRIQKIEINADFITRVVKCAKCGTKSRLDFRNGDIFEYRRLS